MFLFQRKENKTKKKPGENRTGIPLCLKRGMERTSEVSLDDVKVHYNSDKPKSIQALAYTQGNQVYVGPGQEKHLAHELGHVVQQKRGAVHPTTWLKSGQPMNTDSSLERGADEIGNAGRTEAGRWRAEVNSRSSGVVQRCPMEEPVPENTEVVVVWCEHEHTNKTPGHWTTIKDKVDELIDTGKYKTIYVNKGLSREIEGFQPNRRPDIYAVRSDNSKIDQFEVPSKTDTVQALTDRMSDSAKKMGGRAGDITVVPIPPQYSK